MSSGERILSQILRIVRTKRGLSQIQLGELCIPPLTQSAIAQWESGAHPLSERAIEVAASAYGVTTRQLLEEGLAALRERESTNA